MRCDACEALARVCSQEADRRGDVEGILEKLRGDHATMQQTLTRAQARCTELLERARAAEARATAAEQLCVELKAERDKANELWRARTEERRALMARDDDKWPE